MSQRGALNCFLGLTHIDRAPYTSIAVLRSAVEIRIRRAFGIQGYEEASNKNFIPINMTRISEQIKLHLPQINFACDFNDIMRIYRWTNFYLHGGWRDFEWVAGYALQFLRPVFGNATPTPKGGLSINGGIRMPRQVWRDIRQTFSEAAKIGQKLNAADEKDAQCVFLD